LLGLDGNGKRLGCSSPESALRRDHRDSITQLSNTAVHRKNVDDDMLAESCYICMRGWEIGEEVTTLRCECPSWAHEACLAKSVLVALHSVQVTAPQSGQEACSSVISSKRMKAEQSMQERSLLGETL
jgi:hypothetical protein